MISKAYSAGLFGINLAFTLRGRGTTIVVDEV